MKRTLGKISLAALAAGINGANQLDCSDCRGLMLFINITAISGVGAQLIVTLTGVTPSGQTYTILASAALTATGLTVLRVYPGLTPIANLKADDILPSLVRIDTAISGTTPSVTASIDVHQILG